MFFHDLWLAKRRRPAHRHPPRQPCPANSANGSRRRWSQARCAPSSAPAALDLGIDWGDVDLVIQVGAPKNVKRLVQRIGRANHRYNAPSKALLVPANRFEVVECQAALEAVRAHTLTANRAAPARATCCASTS